jgi:hypothetical protein
VVLAQAQIVLFTLAVQELLGKVTQAEVDSMYRLHTKVLVEAAALLLLVQTLLGLQVAMAVPVLIGTPSEHFMLVVAVQVGISTVLAVLVAAELVAHPALQALQTQVVEGEVVKIPVMEVMVAQEL